MTDTINKYDTDEQTATFDDEGFAEVSGFVKVYVAKTGTREYDKAYIEWVTVDTTVSANAYLDAPVVENLPANTAIVRNTDGTAWVRIPDYRGQTVWDKATAQPMVITSMGELAATVTKVEPIGDYPMWDGSKWIENNDAKLQAEIVDAQSKLEYGLEAADANITHIREATDRGVATDDEKDSLDAWISYRVDLNRIDATLGSEVIWPILNVKSGLPRYPLAGLPQRTEL